MAITQTQLEKRQGHIGSSDAPAILGLIPDWRNEADVLMEKLGKAPPRELGEKAWIGTELEPALKSMAAQRIGRKLVSPTATFIHEQHTCLGANVDSLIERSARGQPIVEFKSTGIKAGWGDAGSDEVPDHVFVQVQHQMLCAGSTEAYVACLQANFGLSFNIYHLKRDDAVCTEIERRLTEWWTRHVEQLEPLPAGRDIPSMETLKVLHRTPGAVVSIDPMIMANFLSANAARKQAESEEEEAKKALVAAMGDAESATCPVGTATYRAITSNRFDLDAFRTQHPTLAAEFTAPSTYRRLMAKATKSPAAA